MITLTVFACAQIGSAQTVASSPQEVVTLVGGSTLVGRVSGSADGKIQMRVDGVGDITIDSTAVASRSPVPPKPAPPSAWSGTATGSMTQVSTVAPGLAGSTLGAQVTLGVARKDTYRTLTLDGVLNYWRVEPAAAAVDQWGLTLGGRRVIAPRWVLLGRSMFEVNHVQYLKYRSTTIGGLGYMILKSDRVSLLFAPGLGYGRSEQTDLGRVLSFANGTPPSVDGAITGLHNELTLQLTPMLSFQQDMHYFWSLAHSPFRQADFNARLTGMMSTHFGLSIAFRDQYDTSMSSPVNRTLKSLVSGVQVKF